MDGSEKSAQQSRNGQQWRAVIVMGVAGSGKSMLSRRLARALEWTYLDADDFHGRENIEKMSRGEALTDSDRLPWLRRIERVLQRHSNSGDSCTLACSALKRSYRDILRQAGQGVDFVYLKVNPEVAEKRLARRQEHFMKEGMLAGQMAALEEPDEGEALIVDNNGDNPNPVIAEIIRKLRLPNRHEAGGQTGGS